MRFLIREIFFFFAVFRSRLHSPHTTTLLAVWIERDDVESHLHTLNISTNFLPSLELATLWELWILQEFSFWLSRASERVSSTRRWRRVKLLGNEDGEDECVLDEKHESYEFHELFYSCEEFCLFKILFSRVNLLAEWCHHHNFLFPAARHDGVSASNCDETQNLKLNYEIFMLFLGWAAWQSPNLKWRNYTLCDDFHESIRCWLILWLLKSVFFLSHLRLLQSREGEGQISSWNLRALVTNRVWQQG